MLDWIIKNKEWLFSGIGVAAIGLLFVFGKTIYRGLNLKPLPVALIALGFFFFTLGLYVQLRSKLKVIEDSSTFPAERPYSIDPYTVREKIDSRPPYEREDAEKNYLGLLVEWKGKFSHLERQKDGLIEVSLQAIPQEPRGGIVRPVWIGFTVRLSDYPHFKIMEKDTEVVVRGRIAGFGLIGNIILDGLTLSFPLAAAKAAH